MIWKRNTYSYILWAVYLLGGIAALLYYGYEISSGRSIAEWMPQALAGALVWAGAILGIFIFAAVCRRLSHNDIDRRYGKLICEALVIVGLLAAGLAMRISSIAYAGESAAYYDTARVAEGVGIPQIAHGATYFYVYLLRILFTFVGNKWMAGIWLQIVLQLVACIIWYFAVRRVAGVIPGMILVGIMMLSPTEVMRGLTYSPDMLYLCLYGLGLACVTSLLYKQAKGLMESAYDVILCGFSGAVIGLVCYLDITGITLFILALGVFGLSRKKKGRLWERGWLSLLVLVISGIIFFGSYLWLDSYASGKTFMDIWNAWITLYGREGFNLFFWMKKSETIVISIAFWGMIYSALNGWLRRDGQRITPWISVIVILFILEAMQMTRLNSLITRMFVYIGGLVTGIASVDLYQSVRMRDRKKQESKILEDNMSLGEENQNYSEEVAEDKLVTKGEEHAKVQFIENPLPLPKKHVKKSMDYSFVPDKDQMHYDLEVDENDDFDI